MRSKLSAHPWRTTRTAGPGRAPRPFPFGTATLGLLLVSVIWGTTFVAVKSALDHASPLLFVGVRFAVAAIASLPLMRARGPALRSAILRGIPLGLILAGAYAAQTLGLTITTPARSAFVTGLNVALVPFWAYVITRVKPGTMPIIGLLLTVPGLWLLTSPEGASWTTGDSWTVVCAVLYALYVVLIGIWGKEHDPGALLAPQLAVTAVVCLGASSILEQPRMDFTPVLVGAICMTALFATTGTTWLQLRLQPKVSSTRAAVIYATEPVFAAMFSWIWIGETLVALSWFGGALILGGMLLSEIGTGRGVPERS